MATTTRALLQACMLPLFFASQCRAQIRVMAPETLVDRFKETQGRIDGATSTFGAPYYNDRILGRLVWGESLHDHSHCKDDDYSIPSADGVEGKDKNSKVHLTHIVLVRTGNCSFVTKVQVAQKKGAHAVIVVDSKGLTKEEISQTILADDGYGKNVNIPSMLIGKEDGETLIEAVSGNRSSQVIVELAWDIPTSHVVLVDLWMNSAARDTMHFLQEFAPKRKALSENVKFVPHYHVFSMQSKGAAHAEEYNELCVTEAADLCAQDPDGTGHVTGRMVLEEDVRQLCIHNVQSIGSSAAYAEKFWDYVEALPTKCPLAPTSSSSAKFGNECNNALMSEVGIDVPAVLKCMSEQRDDLLKYQRDRMAWSPRALRIDGWRFTGQLDADLVTRAICAGFATQPKACETLVEPGNPFRDDRGSSGVGFGLTSFLIGLAVTALVVLGALALYKQSLTRHIHSALREEVMLEVQAQLDSYKQMS